MIVDLGDKSDEFKSMYGSISADPFARAKVPILEVGKEGSTDYLKIIESSVVTEFIAANWSARGTALLPVDAALAAKARLFVGHFMDALSMANFSFLATNSEEHTMKV